MPTTVARLAEFRETLTSLVGAFRVVRSAGGAAGGVVSEGMGYALLLAGFSLSAQPVGSPAWHTSLSFGQEVFAGWRRMCELSRGSCQEDVHAKCGGRLKRDGVQARGFAPCLPSWQFDNALRAQQASGSATDGDEDALLGLILMLESTSAESWPLWEQTLSWTFETARAFLRYNTVAHGPRQRLTRLGSCWGGYDCNNPSCAPSLQARHSPEPMLLPGCDPLRRSSELHHRPLLATRRLHTERAPLPRSDVAPGHYRAFRAFMVRHGAGFGLSNDSTAATSAEWDALLESSYAMLEDAQCEESGLVPNWWQPAGPRRPSGSPGCNASGTPADEFGSEAARSVWRVAIDAIWSGDARATQFTARVARRLASRLDEAADGHAGFRPLLSDERCTAVRTEHPNWYWNAFMFAPLSAALLLRLPDAGLLERQRRALALLADRIGAAKITQYYSGAWLALVAPTLNGDLANACERLLGSGGCAPRDGDRLLTTANAQPRGRRRLATPGEAPTRPMEQEVNSGSEEGAEHSSALHPHNRTASLMVEFG